MDTAVIVPMKPKRQYSEKAMPTKPVVVKVPADIEEETEEEKQAIRELRAAAAKEKFGSELTN